MAKNGQFFPPPLLSCLTAVLTRIKGSIMLGFPGGSDGKESACSVGTRVQSLGWEEPLEKETANHSGIPAWEIPWTEEPGGLQSTGSQRVRHD